MPYTFTTPEWNALIQGLLPATISGDLFWEVDDTANPSTTSQQYRATSGSSTFTFFGRFRGYSYRMSFDKVVDGESTASDSIAVTNRPAAEGIPFDELFRLVQDQVKRNEEQARKIGAANSLEILLRAIDNDPPASEECTPLVPLESKEDWETLVAKIILATGEGNLQWESEDPDDGRVYGVSRGDFRFFLQKETNLDYGRFVFSIEYFDGDFCEVRQWEDSSLEALAEAIGIPTRNSEAKFAVIARTAILDEILSDINGKSV